MLVHLSASLCRFTILSVCNVYNLQSTNRLSVLFSDGPSFCIAVSNVLKRLLLNETDILQSSTRSLGGKLCVVVASQSALMLNAVDTCDSVALSASRLVPLSRHPAHLHFCTVARSFPGYLVKRCEITTVLYSQETFLAETQSRRN